MHRENIGRGDKEQPVPVMRLREEPFQFRFKLAWGHPLQGARVSPAAHLPCAPYVADIRNCVQLAWPVTSNQRQKIGQIDRSALPGPLRVGHFIHLPLHRLLHTLRDERLDGIMYDVQVGSFGVGQWIGRIRSLVRWERQITDTGAKN
jgi:hypothetical protein